MSVARSGTTLGASVADSCQVVRLRSTRWMVLVARFWLLAGSRLIVGDGLSTSSSPPVLALVWAGPAEVLVGMAAGQADRDQRSHRADKHCSSHDRQIPRCVLLRTRYDARSA